jgi:hypothetical protein
MPPLVPFADLLTADLVVGATYEGGVAGTAADDPLARLLPCGNQVGFRVRGSARARDYGSPCSTRQEVTLTGRTALMSRQAFLGLAVPSASDVSPIEDLVAVWRAKDGQRFPNYEAAFTVLDVVFVPWRWIDEL